MRHRLAGTILAALLLVVMVPPPPTSAAEYEMSTSARYVVDPSGGEIAVSVEVTFTNTLPDPPGQLSAFTHVDLAIQNGASLVVARDDVGPLHVDVATGDGAPVASVRTRSRVGYNRSVSFTLSYRLADAAAPDLHVRAEIVKFPAWGFGTSSQVSVELPAGYEAHADGDPMLPDLTGSSLVLTSGQITDPVHWLALITAVRPGDVVTQTASVALASGTVDLQVRAWSEDAAWGQRTLSLLVKALPMLEAAIGLPYPRSGPLVVSEAAGGEASSGALPSATAEIEVAFDGSAFTLLHQAAHVWISDRLAADRWIREGLASHYAAQVAAKLGVEPPYDPAAQTAALAADAGPLIGWTGIVTSGAAEAYGYAASWALVDQVAKAVGEGSLAMALKRVVAGLSAYDPQVPDDATSPDGGQFQAVDTRRFLDQLAATSSVDLSHLFGEKAFGPDAAELAGRDAARASYGRLLTAAGDWGAPDPARAAMAEWRFQDAQVLISEASAWLTRRDGLLADVAAAGLVPPDRLRERYALAGGGPDAIAELDAEGALVTAYISVKQRALAGRGLLDAVGLLFVEDPKHLLAAAADSFGTGDLGSAADALDRLELELDRAPSDGTVRLAAAVVLVALLGLGVGLTLRRRSGSHYTAAP
ncbi:MAG: hypothetical protein ACXWL8_05865 [Candidatus Limnocylindria bacterium]